MKQRERDRAVALPIVYRELRVTALRSSTYWRRVGVALVTVFFGCYAFLVTLGAGIRNAGGTLFEICTSLGFLYCVIVGLRNTADCISIEKREGTLGLLLLTDLRGYDVVLGKLFAVGLNSFYGFWRAFPSWQFRSCWAE